MTRKQRIHEYRLCLKRFDSWVDKNLTEDGRWEPVKQITPHQDTPIRASPSRDTPIRVEAYFSIVSYFNYIGKRDRALAVLRQIRETFADPIEVIKQGPHRNHMLCYVPAWYALGAFDAEVFGFSNSLADFITSFQSPTSGGFFAQRESRDSGHGRIDFDTTAMCTIALAHIGRVEASLKSADFFIKLFDAQPDLDTGFNTTWSVPDGMTSPHDMHNPAGLIRWSEPEQHYYKIGLFTLALAHVFGVSGERRYLEYAHRAYDVTVNRAAHLWSNTISHKMCWAASVLFAIGGGNAHLEHACRFADHLITVQQRDGAFHYPELWPQFPPEQWDIIPNAGGQFALWIARTLNMILAI